VEKKLPVSENNQEAISQEKIDVMKIRRGRGKIVDTMEYPLRGDWLDVQCRVRLGRKIMGGIKKFLPGSNPFVPAFSFEAPTRRGNGIAGKTNILGNDIKRDQQEARRLGTGDQYHCLKNEAHAHALKEKKKNGLERDRYTLLMSLLDRLALKSTSREKTGSYTRSY